MTPPRKIVSWAVPTLLAAVLLLLWNFREPRYGGYSLSDWLGDESRASFPSASSYFPARDAAIRAMGPRAVPYLVEMLSARESSLRELFRETRNHFFRSGIPSHWELRNRATIALQILGPAASSAVPRIVQLLEREPHRLELWYLLREIGPSSAAAASLLNRSFSNIDQSGPENPRDDDFHPRWLMSDLSMSWGATWRESLHRDLLARTNSILHRVSCLWAVRSDSEYARSLLPAIIAIVGDPSEPKLLRTASLHALGRIPEPNSNRLEKTLEQYETEFGALASDSILNGAFLASVWSGTNEPPNDPPAPSPLVEHWLTWNGVIGRSLPAVAALKLELGPRTPPGAISQVFRTTPGASYNLQFDAATGRNSIIQITVGDLNTNCIAQSSDPTKPTRLSFDFRAVSPLTTLSFTTVELNGSGPFIDNVSVGNAHRTY
jgi:hypothetical protein